MGNLTRLADLLLTANLDTALRLADKGFLEVKDGITAPPTGSEARIYIDSSDGDLKIKFSDGTVKTIVTDT